MKILYTGGKDELGLLLAKDHEVTYITQNPYEPTPGEINYFGSLLRQELYGFILVPNNFGAGMLFVDSVPNDEKDNTLIICSSSSLEKVMSSYEVRGFNRIVERDELIEASAWWRYDDFPRNKSSYYDF